MDAAWFWALNPVQQAFLATLGTYLLTAIGTTPVLFFRRAPRRLMDALMGAAAGIMVAASCWSLLQPAIEMGGPWPAVVGLAIGGIFIFALDQLLPHLHPEFPDEATQEGPASSYRRAVLLMVAITIHNFPEGLAVGVAFGADNGGAALALALGIGLQNIPEGLAIALPLRREGMNRLKAFWYGQLSATVEPVAGVIGCGLVLLARPVLPYAMAFAAGAMLYVVVEELLPETTRQGNNDVATLGFLSGFLVMMAMDTSLG
jgi:ZIP family zinc transporter